MTKFTKTGWRLAVGVWAAACKKVLLIQPSSAASERVFSLLENSFRNTQARAMEDYIEVSLMLQYNKR